MGVFGIAVLGFFFKRYFGIIQPCGMRFFILLANGIRFKEDPSWYCGPFFWPFLSNVGQYLD